MSTMRLFEFCVILYSFIFNDITAEIIKSTNSCLTTDEDHIELTCNPGEMIHIISFLYQTASEDCNTVHGDCQVLVQSSDDIMIQSCNGQQTCNETISNERINRTCNHRAPVYVTLTYGCISESPVDVCAEASETLDQQLYLISPDYLKRADDFPLVPCECDISGSDMTVEFLELFLPFFPEDRANVTLLGDSGSWSSNPVPNFVMFNKLVLNQTENLTLFYDPRGKTKQHMWLRLQGSDEIKVRCNRQPTTTPTTTITSYTETSFPTTTFTTNTETTFTGLTQDTNTEENPETVVGILSAVIVLLVLALAAVLIFFLYIKPRRLHKNDIRQDHVTDQNNVTGNDEGHGYYNVAATSNRSTAIALEPAGDSTSRHENYEHLTTYANDPTDHHYSSVG